MVDATARLTVLLNQEDVFYRTSEYLERLQHLARRKERAMSTSEDEGIPPSPKKRKAEDCTPEDESPFHIETPGGESPVINKHWREKICEWAYQVVDHFNLHREVVSIAMCHLDRYLAAYPSSVDKNMFQLLAMTCLYLSIKLNEYKHLLIPGSKSSMDTILQLSRGFFTLDEMEKMEYDILQRLQWHVHPPTPQVFVKHYLYFLGQEDKEIYDLAQFMTELSVMDYFFVGYKPSEIAIAALLNAVEKIEPNSTDDLHFPFQTTLFDRQSSNVEVCRKRLNLIFKQATEKTSSDTTSQADQSPVRSAEEPSRNNTTSPVSVMVPPEASRNEYMHDCMDSDSDDGVIVT